LLQAIAFVLFVMLARNTSGTKYLAIGPFALAELWYPGLLGIGVGIRTLPLVAQPALDWLIAPVLLLALVAALSVALVAPRQAWSAMGLSARLPEARRPGGARPRRPGRPGSRSRPAV
jgi:hypothetical protein